MADRHSRSETVGLPKNLALLSEITTDENVDVKILYEFRVCNFSIKPFLMEDDKIPSCVFHNGAIIGVTKYPTHLAKKLRTLRRRGRLSQFISIHEKGGDVYISSDNLSSFDLFKQFLLLRRVFNWKYQIIDKGHYPR